MLGPMNPLGLTAEGVGFCCSAGVVGTCKVRLADVHRASIMGTRDLPRNRSNESPQASAMKLWNSRGSISQNRSEEMLLKS